jgi:hypothetical protein
MRIRKDVQEAVRATVIDYQDDPVEQSQTIEGLAFAIALSDPLVTRKGRESFKWSRSDFSEVEMEEYRRMAFLVLKAAKCLKRLRKTRKKASVPEAHAL